MNGKIKAVEFCTCKKSSSVTSEVDDFGYWLVCCDCDKPIENSYEYDEEFEGMED